MLSGTILKAQFLEFGGGVGGYNYFGDLNRNPRIGKIKPGIQGIYRMNMSEFVSIRTTIALGSIQGDDSAPIDHLSRVRQTSFNQRFTEFSATFEYFFLNFVDNKLLKWSPFAYAGFGLTRLDKNVDTEILGRTQANIPFGIGIKHLIDRKFSIGFEIGARKTFTDLLDGVADGEQTVKDFEFGHPNGNDWYLFTGVTFTYIIYKIPCPFPYIPNRSIFNR